MHLYNGHVQFHSLEIIARVALVTTGQLRLER